MSGARKFVSVSAGERRHDCDREPIEIANAIQSAALYALDAQRARLRLKWSARPSWVLWFLLGYMACAFAAKLWNW